MELNVKLIAAIKQAVKSNAHTAKEDAGYSGSWGDGGASAMISKLDAWLDGIEFAKTGVTELYSHIAARYEKELDPEYVEYIRLQSKFGDNK